MTSELTQTSAREGSPQVLAFYLPQFHHIPENDAWHGRGFTEWSVVAQSKSLYPGHRQPDLPGELGFYDLRVPETRYLQARLAREHAVTGFLYYHYWFGGRRMLGRPFEEVLSSRQPDFPFALCWANESWYRRWQGSIDEMILEQVFSEEDDINHIRWLIRCFKDPRYIRIEGRPLLAVYRAHHLPDPARTVETWRRECEAAGVEPPWLVLFETGDDLPEPSAFGFDASAEFVPHHLPALVGSKPFRFGPNRSHRMYEYEDVAAAYLNRPTVDWQRYPCVASAWDNTPRRQTGEALILHNSTPEAYGRWLAEAATRQHQAAGSNGIVFVNAWNEWAEGAHLEPDAFWGRAYLETTRDVMRYLFGDTCVVPEEGEPVHPSPVPSEELYDDLYEKVVQLQKSSTGFLSFADRRIREMKKYYESKLSWERLHAAHVLEMNEWLTEQLKRQSEQMNAMAVPGVAPTKWLDDPPPPVPSPQEDMVQESETAPEAKSDDLRDGEDEDAPVSWRMTLETDTDEEDDVAQGTGVDQEAEDRLRDDGYDEPPGVRSPQWLVELEAPE